MIARTAHESDAAEPVRNWSAGIGWLCAFGALALLVARRLGAFDLWQTVTIADGSSVRFPNGFAIVDHPFHAARAETLRRAIADGHLLQWIGHHQGGYPIEFYPLGVAALDVVAWAAAFGSLPMMAIHKLVVIAIFLLPLAGYAMIAGFDRRSLGIGLLAGAGHLAVRGWWWSGGAMELIEWGLVTNVAAATSLLLCLPLTVRYFDGGARRAGAMAAALAAFALVTNPRSGLALVCLLAGAGIAAGIARTGSDGIAISFLQRSGLIVIVTALLAAPEIVSLIRYSDLYYFVRYSGYVDLAEYRTSSIQAVGGPFFALGLAGFALAWLPGAGVATRAVAATLAIYVAMTALLVSGRGPGTLIEQLETTRLMPFQRFLWLYLGATAIAIAIELVARLVRARSATLVVDAGLIAASGIVIALYVIAPPSFIPEGDLGLVAMPTSANAGIIDLESAVKRADVEAAPGTALLVLGSVLSWHDQLWAPLWSDRPFFYDDWLWYWQTRNYGDYDPKTAHAYNSDISIIDQEYLSRHGIGAIVVNGEAKTAAREAPFLTLVRAGVWDVYRVNNPTTILTISNSPPAAISVDDQQITAGGTASGGAIVVRRNWFPRWRATVNGEHVPIVETTDGYMTIAAPDGGEVAIELTYELDWIDWIGRAGTALGLLALIVLCLPRGGRFRLGVRSERHIPRVIPRVQSARQ